MQRVKIVEEERKQDLISGVALRLKTKNANLLLLSEGEDQLETVKFPFLEVENSIIFRKENRI